MQREQNLWGLQCLLWPTHAKLLIYAADSVQAFQFQAPTYFKNALCLFNCLFHCLSFSILLHGFERFWDVSIHLYVCDFLPFFLTQVFTPFHICASLFSASFCSSFLFSLQFSFIPSFRALVHRPQLHSSARFIWCGYLLACFSFRLNPRATSGFLQLIYLLTPPE